MHRRSAGHLREESRRPPQIARLEEVVIAGHRTGLLTVAMVLLTALAVVLFVVVTAVVFE